MSDASSEPSLAAKTRKWRWGAVFIALILFGVVAPSLGWAGQVCAEELSAAGAAVDVCRPLGFGDVQVMAGALLLLLLLSPDLSEVTVGLVTLKRLVEDTAAETGDKVEASARETERQIESLRLEVTSDIRLAANQTQNSNLNLNFGQKNLDMPEIREIAERQRREPVGCADATQGHHVDSGESRLTEAQQFLLDWVAVEGVLAWADKGRTFHADDSLAYLTEHPGRLLGVDVPSARVREVAGVVDATATMFTAEIVAARSVRNLMVHETIEQIDGEVLTGLGDSLGRFLATVQWKVRRLLSD